MTFWAAAMCAKRLNGWNAMPVSARCPAICLSPLRLRELNSEFPRSSAVKGCSGETRKTKRVRLFTEFLSERLRAHAGLLAGDKSR
jgi:hypothetical protein